MAVYEQIFSIIFKIIEQLSIQSLDWVLLKDNQLIKGVFNNIQKCRTSNQLKTFHVRGFSIHLQSYVKAKVIVVSLLSICDWVLLMDNQLKKGVFNNIQKCNTVNQLKTNPCPRFLHPSSVKCESQGFFTLLSNLELKEYSLSNRALYFCF